jgi:tetratricopeptide (TPR) repeat protein
MLSPRLVRWSAVLMAAALLLLTVERGFGPPALLGPKWAGGYTDLSLTGIADDYPRALAQADYHLASVNERTRTMPGDWLMHNISARAWLSRARLTGSYEDHAAAKRSIEQAFAVASPGTGPHLTGAVLAFSMHRLPQAERYLNEIGRYAVPPDRDEQAEITAIWGDIAFYRGDYATALAQYDAADRLAPGTSDFRRAIYLSRTGRPVLAEDYFNKAERRLQSPTRQARGTLELQRGILDLDRGRLDDALAHFRRADLMFPGFWLIEEHIAEVTALKGDLNAAENMYRDIVRRTGHPEFMDALAQIAAEQGDSRAAGHWFARAGAAWAQRLQDFPEASYGHAIEHCIAKGDWPCALSLAQRNHRARPYGDAKIALAKGLLGSKRPAEARAVIDSVLATPWRTVDLHQTASEIYLALGLEGLAAEQSRLSRALSVQ